MPKPDRKMRPRRIASDEAHSWARNLKISNPHAKMLLLILALYVDGDGCAFVAIPTLADDCEMSQNTVRRRLIWLESIGAIARVPQWLDQYGNRVSTGSGKRTTDLIRIMIDVDDEDIEARARGGRAEVYDDDEDEFSPPSQRGLNSGAETVSTSPGLQQPSQSWDHLISEPEPESPLTSPPGRRESTSSSEVQEPEDFGPAWEGWPGHQIMRRDLALAEFRLLPAEKQRLCRAAVPLFAALQTKLGRTRVMNFHLWIRSRGFDEFPNAKLNAASAEPERRWVSGDELAGLMVASRMASWPMPRLTDDPERGRGYLSVADPRPDLAALATFVDQDQSDWLIVEQGSGQFAAWRDRLQLWFGGVVPARIVWREPIVPGIHDLSASNPNFRLRNEKRGLRVPAEWPPRRDGTWVAEGEGA